MSIISVDQLSKQFAYYNKEVGLKSSIRNLFKRETLYKDAVKQVSFVVEEGEMVGFLGPNGAGKTTTLKMLSGILYPTAGKVSVMGYTPWERKKEFKRQFAIVMGQKNQLWWDLPANESFHLNKTIYEVEDGVFRKTVEELSELLDVTKLMNVQVRRLSLGERMKLELIAALLHKPKVIFLDEPTIGLDIISQKKIRDFFKYYNQQHKLTVILTSHYMNDIQDLCKRTIIINDGKVAYDGDLARVNDLLNQKKIVKIKLSDVVEEGVLLRYGDMKQYELTEAVLEIDRDEVKAILKQMLDDLPIIDFTIEDLPIEDGIAILYRKGEQP
ncbi:ABC-2 type transport system ATP-binding protein [Paenibacillus phyllosphaerae]|uniref:ABC-2 type transport system ATP-binding protein n=1 Tax=Paenibacillus phyllosphaerae TaxID=274593 RepID=A0A7W5AT14_9BACL|nr:ATP-binding cassette domain-containing protein [Paenibacillus phyllosphaerae]MBB3108127.1 ABC-2 type transport system ATP-binding protein [Paenibacillus phyllosphaerae]